MEQTLTILHKLLNSFILPKYEDIVEYELTPQIDINNTTVEIMFLMDGTEQEIEEEIVNEFYNFLKYFSLPNLRLKFKFTTGDGEFYKYS